MVSNPTFEKKKNKTGSRPGRLGHGSTRRSLGFDWAVAPAGLLVNSDRSSHRVDPPGQAGFNNPTCK